MATNELWNVNSLKIPSTIAAANDPSPSDATILSDEHATLEATRVARTAEFVEFQSRHKELDKEAVEIKARLTKDLKTLDTLTAQTKALVDATRSEEDVLDKLTKRIKTIVNKAIPLQDKNEEIETKLIEKDTKAKKSKRSKSQGNSPLKNPTRMPPISRQSLHNGNEGILQIL
jgi:seryl-tRNA synthetase